MQHWLKHWRDWAMRDFWWLLQRQHPLRLEGIHFSYEKAGVVVRNEAIPWNADTVAVEAFIRFPPGAVRRKSDFQLRTNPDLGLISPSLLQRRGDQELFVVQFRFSPRAELKTVQLLWRDKVVAQTTLPLLSPAQFLNGLRIEQAGTFARLADFTVPCRAVAGKQCNGLMATAVLRSDTALLPLTDMEFVVEISEYPYETRPRLGNLYGKSDGACSSICQAPKHVLPVRLTGAQLGQREAFVIVSVPSKPKRLGLWVVSWKLDKQTLARSEVRILSKSAVRRSLYLADSRYVHQDASGRLTTTRHLPALNRGERLGPYFLVASREVGLAALCQLDTVARHRGQFPAYSSLDSQQVLVTDVPVAVVPGTVSDTDLEDLLSFELRYGTQTLGAISTCPAPTASFTSEGGFKPPPDDYQWSQASEEELNARMMRLLSSGK